MFVKIKNWKVKKGEDQVVIYRELLDESIQQVDKAIIAPLHEGLEDKDVVTHMSLTTCTAGIEDMISFPCESTDRVVDVYLMNDYGKTIDRYIY